MIRVTPGEISNLGFKIEMQPIRGDKKSVNAFLNKPTDSFLVGLGVSWT